MKRIRRVTQKSKETSNKEADEEKELKKIMMSNKQKKLFKKMQYGIEKKENRKTIDQKEEAIEQKERTIEKLN